ncbi:hypothetical protein CR970_00425 [Candidatus Saccharibacteria bacterium]|nr:MAG: hypothetical protein CR970_00425 [Candidatus Saccharibacteria bacterium]
MRGHTIFAFGIIAALVFSWTLQPDGVWAQQALGRPALSDVALQRIANRVASQETVISEAMQERLRQRCVAAQALLLQAGEASATAEDSTQLAYGAVIARLSVLRSRLTTQGVDVPDVQVHISTFKEKYDIYKEKLATHQLALSDAYSLDCQADPAAFSAALQEARQALGEATQARNEAAMYVDNDIQGYLSQLRSTIDQQAGDR